MVATIKYDYIHTKRKSPEPERPLPEQHQQPSSIDLPLSSMRDITDFEPNFLAAKHPHRLDKTIKFYEDTHTYAVLWNSADTFETHDTV